MVDARLIAIVAWISPFRYDHDLAQAKFAPGEFVEVFVDTPFAVAEARDVKGCIDQHGPDCCRSLRVLIPHTSRRFTPKFVSTRCSFQRKKLRVRPRNFVMQH